MKRQAIIDALDNIKSMLMESVDSKGKYDHIRDIIKRDVIRPVWKILPDNIKMFQISVFNEIRDKYCIIDSEEHDDNIYDTRYCFWRGPIIDGRFDEEYKNLLDKVVNTVVDSAKMKINSIIAITANKREFIIEDEKFEAAV